MKSLPPSTLTFAPVMYELRQRGQERGDRTARADRVDERVELAVPAIAWFVQNALDGVEVHPLSDRRGPPAHGGRPGSGRPRIWIPATTADDDCGGVLQPEIHGPVAPRCRSSSACASRRTRSVRISSDTLGPSPFARFARKAYYRSYSRRATRCGAPSTGWLLPVGLTVTAERRHACEDAVQTLAAGRFKSTNPERGGCVRSIDIDGGARRGQASNR